LQIPEFGGPSGIVYRILYIYSKKLKKIAKKTCNIFITCYNKRVNKHRLVKKYNDAGQVSEKISLSFCGFD